MNNGYHEKLEKESRKKGEKRDKKRKPKMKISGAGVKKLQKILDPKKK